MRLVRIFSIPPLTPRPALAVQAQAEELASCHTSRADLVKTRATKGPAREAARKAEREKWYLPEKAALEAVGAGKRSTEVSERGGEASANAVLMLVLFCRPCSARAPAPSRMSPTGRPAPLGPSRCAQWVIAML
mgnify:FL=1